MLTRLVPFILLWLILFLVRFFRIRAYTSRTRRGAGPSGPWGQNPWSQRTNHGQAAGRSAQTKSPHEILGIRPGASRSEITAKYRELVRQYHPDKVANLGPELRELAEQRMKEINAAYDYLKRYASG